MVWFILRSFYLEVVTRPCKISIKSLSSCFVFCILTVKNQWYFTGSMPVFYIILMYIVFSNLYLKEHIISFILDLYRKNLTLGNRNLFRYLRTFTLLKHVSLHVPTVFTVRQDFLKDIFNYRFAMLCCSKSCQNESLHFKMVRDFNFLEASRKSNSTPSASSLSDNMKLQQICILWKKL